MNTTSATWRPRSLLAPLAIVTLMAALAGCSSSSPDTSPGNSDVGPVSADQLSIEDGYSDGSWVDPAHDVPAVTNLNSNVKDALAEVMAVAAADGRDVDFSMTAGWRSQRYQQYLFDQAVIEYGSEEEASRWVKPAGQSEHEKGKAIDFATADAIDWLNRFGADYGFCQVYSNESWHFELTADESGVCPALITDSSVG